MASLRMVTVTGWPSITSWGTCSFGTAVLAWCRPTTCQVSLQTGEPDAPGSVSVW